ncbi:MAG: hypothetical protein HRT89_04670, partial [Lentisphaeria bacterium]|nr:hypothetical protein [Lentisphaeria bacterium]NQZ67341.1 hypothetical protein [Lentisphaeria bacterium]
MQVIINISDGQKRDSRVTMESGNKINNVSYKTKNGHNVDRFRGVKGSLETNLNALTKDCSLEELSAKLVDGDPEIDLELFGK